MKEVHIPLVKSYKDIASQIYATYFPDSMIGTSDCAFSYDGFYISLFLSKDYNEVSNGILLNDYFSIRLLYSCNTRVLELVRGAITALKTDNPAHYCESQKVKFRKTKIKDESHFAEVFEKFVKNLRKDFETLRNNDRFLPNPHFNIMEK